MNQEVGKRFPDLELPAHDGNKVKLSALTGGFPMVVVFFRGHW